MNLHQSHFIVGRTFPKIESATHGALTVASFRAGHADFQSRVGSRSP